MRIRATRGKCQSMSYRAADTPKDDAEFESAIGKMFAEMEREREQMKKDQEEIDRLKARTRATLAQIEAALRVGGGGDD
jgi:glutathione S-transferase